MDPINIIILLCSFIVATIMMLISLLMESMSRGGSFIGGTQGVMDEIIEHNSKKLSEFGALYERAKESHGPKVLLDDIEGEIKYRSGLKLIRPNAHFGQRKLFLSELEFLSLYGKHSKYVIYAGAAPSNHTYELARYFPDHKFILVDPRQFDIFLNGSSHNDQTAPDIMYLKVDPGVKTKAKVAMNITDNDYVDEIIKNDYRIYIIQDFFTNDMAKLFAPLEALFICDIRTRDESSDTPTSLDIIWNLAQQYNWLSHSKAKYSYLKFRFPWYDFDDDDLDISGQMKIDLDMSKDLFGIDFVADAKKGQLRYPEGKIYIQAFAPVTSTESRLLVGKDAKIKDYGKPDWYDNKFFFYNNIERGFVTHDNPYADKNSGFDHCGDCALEARIWEMYRDNINKTFDPKKGIVALTRLLHKPLRTDFHGFLFPQNDAKLKEIYAHLVRDYQRVVDRKYDRKAWRNK